MKKNYKNTPKIELVCPQYEATIETKGAFICRGDDQWECIGCGQVFIAKENQ